MVCQADDSHEMSRLLCYEKKQTNCYSMIKINKNKCPLLQILLGALGLRLA